MKNTLQFLLITTLFFLNTTLGAQKVGLGKLDVAGSINSTGNLDIDGNLTVNAGKGVVRNYNGTQFKYYTREAASTTNCKCRLLNTSPNAVNYDVTYNIICIGQ